MKLTIEFTHFWHCGSGHSGGKKVDALVEKDEKNIPFVPGKTLRGVLREAVRQAEAFKLYQSLNIGTEHSIETLLFGSREETRDKQISGLLAVTDACVSPAEHNYLGKNQVKTNLLCRDISRTAINHKTGAAIDKSLRTQEVAIPMNLSAELDTLNISVNPFVDQPTLIELRNKVAKQIAQIINIALPYVDGIGALRQRGLGRCVLSLEE